ncbi:MMS19 nucleotide excision repair protein homolog [Lytechinus variegatus]|uniref:MMS19 nucleotide excision repair protein homolog n=1 Tax=Lytechinus variegatus TaxID=7654 RepID=UPI001BB26494|nr:MMS19 nucleotide excision repair protein homolog [Lytechinus variegatus]
MAATMWTEAIENYVRGEQKEALKLITAEITNGQKTVDDFVDSMGTYLMSNETRIRARGVELMSEVLTSLPRTFLNQQQIQVLIEFLCARLLDHHSITQHTLKGLLPMTSQSSFPASLSVQVMTAIFKEVQVQTMLQVDRRTVYNIISNLLRTSLTELQGMGSEFVLGFLHAMDGEKDPRNLILLFNILPTVINNFKIDMFIEETFEVVACYYPVDFHPPPNDPYGISREKLAQSLKTCLSSTPKFAQFCLPMIMEKLSSDLQTARLDSYQLLQACAPVYSQSDIMSYIEAIWSYCRKELMLGISVELDKEAAKTLGAVVTAVSSGIQSTSGGSGDGDLNSFLRNILTECRQHLCEPDHRMIHPCSKLLVAIAAASYPACIAILKYAVPILLDQFNIFDQTRERMVLLDILERLLHSSQGHIKEPEDWRTLFAHHMDTVVTTVLSSFARDQGVPDLRKIGLGTLREMVQVPILMDQSRLELVGQELTRVLLEEGDEGVRCECIKTVSSLAKKHTDFVKSTILTSLWTTAQRGGPGYQRIVVDMATIVTNTSDDLSRSLTSELVSEIAKPKLSSDQHLVYLATLETLTANLSSTPSNLESLLASVVYPLLKMVVSATLQSSTEAGISPHCCGEVLVAIAKVIRVVVPRLDNSMGIKLCQCAIDVFLHGELSSLELTNHNTSVPFLPLAPHAPGHQTQLVTVLQPIVCSLRREVHLPSSKQLMSSLLHISAHSTVWLTSTWATKALAGVINKHQAGSDLDEVLVEAESLLGRAISSMEEGSSKERALMAWVLLTKALVMRSHPKATTFLTTLLRLLEDEDLGDQVPQTLGMLLEDMEDVLSEELHSDIKIMYKQRVFLQALPFVMALFNKDNLQTRAITALCHLLPSIPRPVLLAELPPIIPRLVQSLRVTDPRPTLPILDILESLLGETLPSLVDQIDNLIPTLLELSSYQASLKVRIASLKCIGAVTSFPHHIIYPHQETVVRALAPRLDDKKRLVRQEAVKARTKWILLQQDTKR